MPENIAPEPDELLDDSDDGLDPNNEDADGAVEDDAEDDGEALPDEPPGEH